MSIHHYNSLTEFCAAARLEYAPQDSSDYDWFGCRSLEHAKQLALRDKSRHLDLVNSMRESIHPGTVTGVNEELALDVTGRTFDVGLVLAGVPECWIAPIEVLETKQYRFFVNIGCSAAVEQNVIARRGAALVLLIEKLEAAGNRCELTIGTDYRWKRSGESRSVTVKIKASHESLDVDRVAFALCDTSLSRKLMFSWLRTQENGCAERVQIKWGEPFVPADCDLELDRMFSEDSRFTSVENCSKFIAEWCSANHESRAGVL